MTAFKEHTLQRSEILRAAYERERVRKIKILREEYYRHLRIVCMCCYSLSNVVLKPCHLSIYLPLKREHEKHQFTLLSQNLRTVLQMEIFCSYSEINCIGLRLFYVSIHNTYKTNLFSWSLNTGSLGRLVPCCTYDYDLSFYFSQHDTHCWWTETVIKS